MDRAAHERLKRRLRVNMMEWISEEVNAGEDYRECGLTVAAFITAEAVAIAKSLGEIEKYLEIIAPIFQQASPEHATILTRTAMRNEETVQ